MNPAQIVLTPDAAVALTRLVLSYCLGRGSICRYSRSYVLQIHHPKELTEYAFYQWRRLLQFVPCWAEPRFTAVKSDNPSHGSWRLRISSRHFETAWRLLYPNGFMLTSEVLELLGAEAIGALWADRGRVVLTRGTHYCSGRLNLSRYSFQEAALLHEWIRTLTGAKGRIHHGRSPNAPMIYYGTADTGRLLDAIGRTWMATAPCLEKKFRRPQTLKQRAEILHAERLEAELLNPLGANPIGAGGISVRMPQRHGGRRAITAAVDAPAPEPAALEPDSLEPDDLDELFADDLEDEAADGLAAVPTAPRFVVRTVPELELEAGPQKAEAQAN